MANVRWKTIGTHGDTFHFGSELFSSRFWKEKGKMSRGIKQGRVPRIFFSRSSSTRSATALGYKTVGSIVQALHDS